MQNSGGLWRLGGWTLGIFCLIFSLAQAEEIRYDTRNKRDPFQPLVGPHAFHGMTGRGKGILPLEGVVFDPQKGSYAVIGGSIYREGESIDGAKLVKVLPDRIVMLQETDEVVIWLHEEVIEAGQKKEQVNEKK